MRLNRQFLCFLAASCALSLLCSRSDVITGAGGGLVSDMDPSLTDTRKGFAQVNLDAGAVDSAFSLPVAADPAVSTQVAGYVLFGVNRDGDTLAAHMQYRAQSFVSLGASPVYAAGDAFQGAYLYFRAADDSPGASGPIAVYKSDTLVGLDPVNPLDRDLSAPGIADTGKGHQADNWIGEFALSGTVDSMPLPGTLAEEIFRTRASDDTSAAFSFAFSILGYDGALRKTYNPYVIVHVERNGKAVRDSISGFTRFTAFEDASASARAASPYSSQHTLRTAVFRVNLRKMVDTLGALGLLSSGSSELLIATIAAKCNRDADPADTSGGGLRFVSANIGSYRIVVLDTLLTNEAPADSTDAVNLRSLRGQFSAVSSSAPNVPFSVHSIKTPLRNAIEKYNRRNTAVVTDKAVDPYIYIYLRPAAENSMILWDKPPKVETIFTPSRSQ